MPRETELGPPCCYRLARADEISGITLGNPDERLLLWLQLRLSDQLGA